MDSLAQWLLYAPISEVASWIVGVFALICFSIIGK